MGWYYRKSVSIGPFRLSVSKSGIGVSLGRRGLRTGLTARGQWYTWLGVPRMGFVRRSGGRGCFPILVLSVVVVVVAATLSLMSDK